MIRESTLCSFAEWVRPTADEIIEALEMLDYTRAEWAGLMGVQQATISRWTTGKVKIPYTEWATICYLTGLGDIWEKEDRINKIQKKADRARVYFIRYTQAAKRREDVVLQHDFE